LLEACPCPASAKMRALAGNKREETDGFIRTLLKRRMRLVSKDIALSY
jgi:hypothetical protein